MGLLLMLLALLPIVGFLPFVRSEFIRTNDTVTEAGDIAVGVQRVRTLLELRDALLEERGWRIVLAWTDSIGLDPSVVPVMVGVDPVEALTGAVADVDRLRDELDPSPDLTVLDTTRSSDLDDPAVFGAQYFTISENLTLDADRLLRQLVATTGDTDNGAGVAASLDLVAAATDLQRATILEFTNYFAVRLFSTVGERDGSTNVRKLFIDGHVNRERVLTQLSDVAEGDPAIADLLTTDDPQRLAYRSEVDQLSSDLLDGSAQEFAQGSQLDLIGIGRLYQGAIGDSEAASDLLQFAADRAEAEATEMSDKAAAETQRLIASMVGLIAAAIFGTIVIRGAMVRPMQRLAVGADRIRNGDTSHQIPLSGPRDVREASQALNEAANTLALVERQAQALAIRQLDADALKRPSPGQLGDSIHGAVETLARSIEVSDRLQAQLAHQASHDELTGATARAAILQTLREELDQADDDTERPGVIFVDLDHFKAVNDTHGHAAGDRVLREVVQRLRGAVGSMNFVGRLGGDEFLIVVPNAGSLDRLERCALLAHLAIDQPIAIRDGDVRVGSSMGVALALAHETDADLLHRADLAAYEAKGSGRNNVVTSEAPKALAGGVS